LKKDRQCGVPPYPTYPTMPGMMPGAAGMPGMMPGATGMPGMMPGAAGMPGMMPGAAGMPGMMPGAAGMPGMMPGAAGMPTTVGPTTTVPSTAGTQPGPGYGMQQPGLVGNNQGANYIEQNFSRMQQQIDMLDRRVSQLKSAVNNVKPIPYASGNKYSDSSYHMM